MFKIRKIPSVTLTAILLALSLSSRNSEAGYALELGADETGFRHELHYHWRSEFLSLGLIANSSGDENIPIATVAAHYKGLTLSFGRIGLPLGLTPPAYSSSVEMPSEYRVNSALLRSLVGLLAVPAVGFSAKYSIGNLDIQAGAFESREVSAFEAVTVTTALSPLAVEFLNGVPNAQIRPCRPLAAALNICDPSEDTTSQVEELLFALGFTEETLNVERSIFEPVRHFGAYWTKGNLETAADVVLIDTLDGWVHFGMAGFAYHSFLYTFTWQFIHSETTKGQVRSLILHEPWGGAYFRQALFDGGFEGSEVAVGLIYRHRAWSFQGGLERVNDESQLIFGASYEFGG